MKRNLNEILKWTEEADNGCLLWTRCLNTDGYPRALIDGNANTKVHRVVYELFSGEALGKYVVRHKCDNPICLNPNHLEKGTNSENIQDRVLRDRSQGKLKSRDAISIRELYREKRYTQKELSLLFGVHVNTINSIINRKHFKHV